VITEFFIDGENSDMVKIIAACRSKKKDTKKEPVAKGALGENYGLLGGLCKIWLPRQDHEKIRLKAKLAMIGCWS
jgi:hypothetical protein